jgi:hypothetical protein
MHHNALALTSARRQRMSKHHDFTHRRRVLAGAITLALAACGGGGNEEGMAPGRAAAMTAEPVAPAKLASTSMATSTAANAEAGLADAAVAAVLDPALARTPELFETSRLAERRTVITGDRLWQLGTADGTYPAAGFHSRGEMGGFWTPAVKLLDGVWFTVDDTWAGPAVRTTNGWGYTRTDLPKINGVAASRTDFVPDGLAAGLIALTLSSATTRTVALSIDAHSELMSAYPWGETMPSQSTVNLPDSATIERGRLLFRDQGTPPGPNQLPHDWAAAVGSRLSPVRAAIGSGFRGPQSPPVICPASGPSAPPQPDRCDDTAYGKGAGGRLTYRVPLTAGQPTTVWFAVAGSQTGPAAAREVLATALRDPARLLAEKVAARQAVASYTTVDLPGNPLLARSVEWAKQNLADSVQEARDLQLRVTRAGTEYPAPAATLDSARWFGAGWPDYTWLFGTDGEYTAFAAVAGGQFETAKAHLRALRDVSDRVNAGSGKIVHEVTPDGAVYFGANDDAGNTDESSKFPSAVALLWRWSGDRRFLEDLYPAARGAMRFVASLDADGDGWPEGLGNVEREGMGEEKLDNAVYTIRGYADLADLAGAIGDRATARWATSKAADMLRRFESTWWYAASGARAYADSLDDPGNAQVFQRHWIGLTPTDAVLPRGLAGLRSGPVASIAHGNATLAQHERPCFTGENGLFHTGTGPTSAAGGNPGASCDSVVSAVASERNIFTLNSAIAAVSEGNFGRLAPQRVYSNANARAQLDAAIWETPGAMPEIVPSPDFGANIDRKFTERSMALQAWGTYGVLWPVVAQQLGVEPDAGRAALRVVPQLPPGQNKVAGRTIRVGTGTIDVSATRAGKALRTDVVRHVRLALTAGIVLPPGSAVMHATLDGRRITPVLVRTARGMEAVVTLPPGTGATSLVVWTL